MAGTTGFGAELAPEEVEADEAVSARFEANRPRLHAMAQRMLGSRADAEDAVQEAWLRLARADVTAVTNLDAWLTTVTVRVCLNVLRSRGNRREEPAGVRPPEAERTRIDQPGPEEEALLAEEVAAAVGFLLAALGPAERLAFVLHDLFDVPFADLAPIVGSSPAATRQLASRARRRLRSGQRPHGDTDPARQRAVVEAFLAASRGGDLRGLLAVLDPDVVLRHDPWSPLPDGATVHRGAASVAGRALLFARPGATVWPVAVGGAVWVVVAVRRRPVAALRFLVRGATIGAITALTGAAPLRRLELAALDRAALDQAALDHADVEPAAEGG